MGPQPSEKRLKRMAIWILAAAALAASSLGVKAAVVEKVTEDLEPLDGYVVMERDGEFIIDLDARDSVSVGDLFSVIAPGDRILHPVTGKVLGSLGEVTEVLRVVRVKDGFSFARPLGDAAGVERGDRIRRFSELKAVFWDYTGTGRPVYDRLQKQLPALRWQGYAAAQAERPARPRALSGQTGVVLFIAADGYLTVRDAHLALVRRYPLPDSFAGDGKAASPIPAAGVDEGKTASEPSRGGPAAAAHPGVAIDFGREASAERLGMRAVMADMLAWNGSRKMAATNGETIDVYSVDVAGRLALLARGDTPGYGQILSVTWWQPSADRPPYLAVNTWTKDEVAGYLFTLENQRLEIVAGGLKKILGAFDTDSDGRPETLLSQRFDSDSFFDRRIKQLRWSGTALESRDPDLPLPAKFTVIGSRVADLTGDGKPEVAYVRNGVLWIYHGNKRLYASPRKMGGSLSVLTYKTDPGFIDYRARSVFFEIAPVAADLDKDGRNELLAVSSDRSTFKVPAVGSRAGESRLVVFKYENDSFVQGTLGEPIEAAVQGLAVVGKKVIYVASEAGAASGGSNASRLHVLPLAQ